MKNYESFKEKVVPQLQLLAQQNGYRTKPVVVLDGSIKKDGLQFSMEGIDFAPVVYLREVYISCLESRNLMQVLSNVIDEVNKTFLVDYAIGELPEKEYLLNNVVISLINKDINKILLSNVPSREYLDLSIVYRCIVAECDNGIGSFHVTNRIVEGLGLTEEELFSRAYKNTLEKGYNVEPIEGLIRELSLVSPGLSDDIQTPNVFDIDMLFVSNLKGLRGASVMVLEQVLEDIASVYGPSSLGYYILPSSIHEFITMKAEKVPNVCMLRNMVSEINDTEVPDDEILSYSVYYYDSKLKKLSIVEPQEEPSDSYLRLL